MTQRDGAWHCDVCDAQIPAGRKRYPLDSGRVCCDDCWQEVRPVAAQPGAAAQTRAELDRFVRISGTVGGTIGFTAGLVLAGFLGSVAVALAGWLCGTLLGFFVTRRSGKLE